MKGQWSLSTRETGRGIKAFWSDLRQAVGLQEIRIWTSYPGRRPASASLRRVSPWAGMNDAVGVGIGGVRRCE